MKKILISFLLFSSMVIVSYNQKDLLSNESFQHFITVDEQDYLNHDVMYTIFSNASFNYKKLLSAVRKDIAQCKRYIKQCPDNACHEQNILQSKLYNFLNYIKKHKYCCLAMQLHEDIKQRYINTFNNQKLIQSIQAEPHLHGIPHQCKNKYKTYFKQVLKDLAKIDKYEDYLHGDYNILKAQNYVLKIELIKVRNAIYHNNRYKYEVSYF